MEVTSEGHRAKGAQNTGVIGQLGQNGDHRAPGGGTVYMSLIFLTLRGADEACSHCRPIHLGGASFPMGTAPLTSCL